MAVICEQLHAKAVNRSKESAVKRDVYFRTAYFLQDALPCALLHFVRGAMALDGKGERFYKPEDPNPWLEASHSASEGAPGPSPADSTPGDIGGQRTPDEAERAADTGGEDD